MRRSDAVHMAEFKTASRISVWNCIIVLLTRHLFLVAVSTTPSGLWVLDNLYLYPFPIALAFWHVIRVLSYHKDFLVLETNI